MGLHRVIRRHLEGRRYARSKKSFKSSKGIPDSAFNLYGCASFFTIVNPPCKAVAGGHTLEAVLSYRYHVLVSQVVTPPEFSGTSNVCAASNGLGCTHGSRGKH